MRRAFLLVLVLLAGCSGAERRERACREAFVLLTERAAESVEERGVVLTARGAGRAVDCRFGGETPGGPELLAIALDGAELSPVRTALLRYLLRLPTPAALLGGAPVASHPPAARLAYALQQLVNGIALGAVLGLVAVGYALVYGVTGTIQFAYGELYMVGAVLFVGVFVMLGAALPMLGLALLAGAAMAALYGWAAERAAFRPIRDSGVLPALIAAIGLSIALREWVRLAGGSGNKWLPPVLADRFRLWEGGAFEVLASGAQVLALVLAAMAAGVLAWALRRTRLGLAWRACSDDLVAASLLGVDVPRTVAAAVVTGAALAGVAGALVALQFGEADFSMGYLMGFKALTAALLGGFGSIAGAFVGALLIGLLEAFWSAAFGLAWKDAAVFAVLIAVLVLRPEGLLGTAQSPRGR